MDIKKHIKPWLEGDLKQNVFDKETEAKPESKKEIEAYRQIIDRSGSIVVPKGRSKKLLWNELEQKIQSKTAKSKQTNLRNIFYYSAAAIAILFFGIMFLPNFLGTQKLIVKAAEHKSLILPDGSEVTINSVSGLKYSTRNWQKERLVQLEGEAFFRVKKGSRFTVKTANGKVEVKGTAFNVYSREKQMEVKCIEGIVSVSSKTDRTVLLKQNEGVKFLSDKKNMEPFVLEPTNKDLWLNGQFYFKNEQLENIFKEIERQFAVKIEFADKTEHVFSGYFSNKSLDKALQMVCAPMGLKFKLKNGKVLISKSTEQGK